MADKPVKVSRLTLFAPSSHLAKFNNIEDLKKSKSSLSWTGEDYRQLLVNKDGKELAVPSQDDYVLVPIRHLSAGIVAGGSWRSTEFPEKVLKKSAPLLQYKPMYENHSVEIGNNVALVGEVKWVGPKKDSNGVMIPGGLEAPAIIDSLLHTDLCRKLLAWPVPHIQSVSVTVVYEWEPSHDFKDSQDEFDWYEFERNVGKVVEGSMVRRVATNIIDFIESSFVYLGADPYAKIKIEDDLFNIDWPSVVSPEKYENDNTYKVYEKNSQYFISLSNESYSSSINLNVIENKKNKNDRGTISNQKLAKMNDEVLEFLSTSLGIPKDEITVDVLGKYSFIKKSAFSKLPEINGFEGNITGMSSLENAIKEANQKHVLVADEHKAYKEIVDALSSKDADGKVIPLTKEAAVVLKDRSDYGSRLQEANKKECERLYRLSVGEGNADEEIIKMISKSSPSEVVALLKQYGGSAAEEFSIQIDENGNHTFRQTTPEGGDEHGGDVEESTYIGSHKY